MFPSRSTFSKAAAILGGLLVLSAFTCSCSNAGGARQMKEIIHGVVCDPSRSTLVAEETNETEIDRFDDLERVKLYRTAGGHYFIQSEQGYSISLHLIDEGEATSLSTNMKQQSLNFAFND